MSKTKQKTRRVLLSFTLRQAVEYDATAQGEDDYEVWRDLVASQKSDNGLWIVDDVSEQLDFDPDDYPDVMRLRGEDVRVERRADAQRGPEMSLVVTTHYALPDDPDLDGVRARLQQVLERYLPAIASELGGRWQDGEGEVQIDRRENALGSDQCQQVALRSKPIEGDG
jgi:hypothetical protein